MLAMLAVSARRLLANVLASLALLVLLTSSPAEAYYARTSQAMTGSTNIVTVPFPYISQSDVTVFINGTPTSAYTWLTTSTIQFAATAGSLSGKTVIVERVTQVAIADVVFAPGSLDPNDLNTNQLQDLYALQEMLDAIVAGVIVATPASFISFTGLGTGAAPSTVDAKLKQGPISLADFSGADPTDQFASDSAITAWLAEVVASGKCGYVPKGTYMTTAQTTFQLSSVLTTGICIYGDGVTESLFDGRTVTATPAFQVIAGGGSTGSPAAASFIDIEGLGFLGNFGGVVFALGKNDFSDVLSTVTLNIWASEQDTTSAANACLLNSVTGPGTLTMTCNNSGHGDAIKLRNVNYATLNLSAGHADNALHITSASPTSSNTFLNPQFGPAATTDVYIDASTGGNNVFIGGNYDYANGAAGVTATAGSHSGDLLINPTDSPRGTDNFVVDTAQAQIVVLAPGSSQPTLGAGWGSTPAIVSANGTSLTRVYVGTGGSASSGAITMPAGIALDGWSCSALDITTQSSSVFLTKETATSPTSVTVTNYNTSGSATAWASGDIVLIGPCVPY